MEVLPHRPTKGLSERLRRPFGASPFGNLRAQMLSYLFLEMFGLSLTVRFLMCAKLPVYAQNQEISGGFAKMPAGASLLFVPFVLTVYAEKCYSKI